MSDLKAIKDGNKLHELSSKWWTCRLTTNKEFEVFFEDGEAIYACSESRKQRMIERINKGEKLPELRFNSEIGQVVVAVNDFLKQK
ncbi:hypothetical protein [Parashewanella tropica]|uniref:hypothetical protein n=1 Tax=Parashewanella tropica TaxID=2547970 RepID=UPI001478FE09|nr:hypothetical protein [Parashewanella tropica]